MAYIASPGGVLVPGKMPRPVIGEIASIARGRDITRGYIDSLFFLEPQDRVLLEQGGGNYELYEELLRDEQIKLTLEQRRLAVSSREWEVIPGDNRRISQKAAAHLRELLNYVDWDGVTEKMLYGRYYGFAVAECLWAKDGTTITVEAIKVKKQRRFRFNPASKLLLLTHTNPTGEELPLWKFWHFCCGADNDDEPHGLGLAHWLYWPVLFKRGGIRLWLTFLDKFASPTALGRYRPGASTADQAKLLASLGAIQTEAGIILPEGMAVELLEAARSGTADYDTLYTRMNQAIAKVVLGQLMTSEAVGGQYKAEVQMDVRQDLVKADADLVCGSFNRGPARWLTDWNYPGAAYPQVWRRIEDEPDLKPQAERDSLIVSWGYEPTEEYVQANYGQGFVKAGPTDSLTEAEPGAESSSEPESIDIEPNTTDVQATALNGAQISSLVEVVAAVAEARLEKSSAVQILMVAFPTITPEIAASIIEPTAQSPQPNPKPAENDQQAPPTPPATALDQEPSPQFQEASRGVRTPELFAQRLGQQAQPEFAAMFDSLRPIFTESATMDEILTRLDSAYPDLGGEGLVQLMGEAFAAARLAGLYEAQEGE